MADCPHPARMTHPKETGPCQMRVILAHRHAHTAPGILDTQTSRRMSHDHDGHITSRTLPVARPMTSARQTAEDVHGTKDIRDRERWRPYQHMMALSLLVMQSSRTLIRCKGQACTHRSPALLPDFPPQATHMSCISNFVYVASIRQLRSRSATSYSLEILKAGRVDRP